MGKNWTFSQRVSAGFAALVAVLAVLSVVAVVNLRSVVRQKDNVINVSAPLKAMCEKLLATSYARLADLRGYVITRDADYLRQMKEHRASSEQILQQIGALSQTSEEKAFVDHIAAASQALNSVHDQAAMDVKNGVQESRLITYFDGQVAPRAEALGSAVDGMIAREEALVEESKRASSDAARAATNLVVTISVAGVALATALAIALSRILGRQIGSAVQHIQSSSSELQAAASQQTSGTREQVTSMNEISTTIKELLSTSRQIAESARRVAEIAENTAAAAKAGDLTVQKAQEAIVVIKQQVDVVVNHMLDLGRKSQQAGGILEVINELSEQTNILAINATIEAAGAGEFGKRFIVVADEIRKLADRVGGSTKDIRTLIDEIRGAVNATVMATEAGSKSVDAGTRQFGEVTTAFKEITGMVGTSRDAAKEIELSTKQQSSSVEQVSSAISNIAQTAKESEASSTQTLQTVSELTNLARGLAQLVQSGA